LVLSLPAKVLALDAAPDAVAACALGHIAHQARPRKSAGSMSRDRKEAAWISGLSAFLFAFGLHEKGQSGHHREPYDNQRCN
jgi:hypothetical protein